MLTGPLVSIEGSDLCPLRRAGRRLEIKLLQPEAATGDLVGGDDDAAHVVAHLREMLGKVPYPLAQARDIDNQCRHLGAHPVRRLAHAGILGDGLHTWIASISKDGETSTTRRR